MRANRFWQGAPRPSLDPVGWPSECPELFRRESPNGWSPRVTFIHQQIKVPYNYGKVGRPNSALSRILPFCRHVKSVEGRSRKVAAYRSGTLRRPRHQFAPRADRHA
jgi:hypothetical protein